MSDPTRPGEPELSDSGEPLGEQGADAGAADVALEQDAHRAGVVAGGTAAVATVAETARTVADVKYSTQALGDWLVPVLLIAVVALCGYIIWHRVNQRKQGWA